jgi:aerobic-type carbon monoxide dehydrogenase small subunit (CoxS/CutS family)
MITLTVNGTQHDIDLEPETPLLWALRDAVGLTRHEIRLWNRRVWRLHRPH